jgi:hypothetical protein
MGLFAHPSEKAVRSSPVEAESKPREDPELIARYKRDHRTLVSLFVAAQADFAAGRLEQAFSGLGLVRQGLQRHVFDENIHLYFALERQYRNDLQRGSTVTIYRIDMNGIFKAVLQFFETWSSVERIRDGRELFARELEGIGAALVKRIEDEEKTLYPLYVGP